MARTPDEKINRATGSCADEMIGMHHQNGDKSSATKCGALQRPLD